MSLGVIAAHAVAAAAGGAYDAAVMADLPLGYWKQAEPSGTTMVDSSGNAHDGTYSGGVTLGQTGLTADGDTCADYNGSSGHATVTNGAWMNVSTFTVECIIKADSVALANCGLVSRDANGTTGPFWLRLNAGKLELIGWTGGSSSATTATGTTSMSTGTRYHLAGVYDGAHLLTYVNGINDGSAVKTGTPNNTAEQLHIGAWFQNTSHVPGFWYDGRLDKVAFYGSALSAARIAAHAAAM